MASLAIVAEGTTCFRPHQFLARENERPEAIFRIEEGWAYRFHLFGDGRRQITALFLPGDYCEPQWGLGQCITQPVVAITPVRTTRIVCQPATAHSAEYHQQLRLALAKTIERQADWLVSLGRRSARERIAQLLCEIYDRLHDSGRAYAQQCAVPLTQQDIADITGLTAVHVNRTLQAMRSAGLVYLQSKWLRIPDMNALRHIACCPEPAPMVAATERPPVSWPEMNEHSGRP